MNFKIADVKALCVQVVNTSGRNLYLDFPASLHERQWQICVSCEVKELLSLATWNRIIYRINLPTRVIHKGCVMYITDVTEATYRIM